MKAQMKKAKITVVFICSVMLAVFLPAASVRAADVQSYYITGDYRQTEARTMLDMINSFRTGPEAWQYNESNQRIPITGLQGLQYDYNLEKIAMQRAMELVVAYSHTRPNGESCFTAYTSGYGSKAENIAIGTGNMTAAYVFELWKESDKFYDGQGHRRNMLGRQYRAVGISHVYYNGCHYWVQEFGDAVVSSAPTTPNDQTTTVEVPVSSALNPTLTYRANPSSYKMIPGEICDLPTVTAELRTNETWYGAPSASVQSVGACDWTVQDKKYGFVTGTYQFAAMKVGQTNLVTTIGGQTITVPVTISNSNNNGGNSGNNSGGNSGGSGGDTGSNRVDLSTATIRLAQDSYVYDGYAKTPAVIVTLNGYTLKQDTDYTVKYSNNVSVGTAVVTVTGIGNYTGSASTTFTIIAQQTFDLSRAQITLSQNSYVYDGYAKTPAVTVTLNGYTLRQNTDYTVRYSNNVSVGTATVTVTGIGSYTGYAYATFTITTAQQTFDLSRAQVTLSQNSYVYDGYAKTPTVTVTLNGYTLRPNIDYTVRYSNNVSVGTATVTVTGIGSYTGYAYATFTITTAQQTFDLSRAQITLSQNSYAYDGYAKTPTVTVTLNGYTLRPNIDYTVSYSNNISAGTATVVVTGIGSYTGSTYATFTITGQQSFDLSRAQITLSQNSYVYDGYAKTPTVTVTLSGYTLKQDTDYAVMYSSNTYAGTASVTVFGINNYTGMNKATFTITQPNTSITAATVTLLTNSYVYDGYAKTPVATVMLGGNLLKLNTDYTVSYSNNKKAGTAHVTITGINSYKGSVTKDFTITKAQNTVTVKKSNYYLTSSKKAQTVTLDVTKKAGTITYSSNKAKVKVNKNGTVTIAKNFTGTAVITVKVTANNYKTVTKKVYIYVY